MCHLIEIEFGSEPYRQELLLRDAILRKPIGLKLPERMDDEAACRHFGLIRDGELLACLIAVPLEPGTVRIRQMAVQSGLQGTGLGRRLMLESEAILKSDGVREFILHARATAIGFYEKLGYRPVGNRFTEVGIPHVLMEKHNGLLPSG